MTFVTSSNEQTFVGVFSATAGIALSTLSSTDEVYNYALLHFGDTDRMRDFCFLVTFSSSLPGKVFSFPQHNLRQPRFVVDLYALDLANPMPMAASDGSIEPA